MTGLALARPRTIAKRYLIAVRGRSTPRDAVAVAVIGVIGVYWLIRVLAPAGGDAYAYWSADLSHLYAGSRLEILSYVYPPPLAQFVQPLRFLPYSAFYGLILAAELAALCWFVTPRWAAVLVLVAQPNIALELINANINLLLGAAILAGFRWRAAWAILLLTKVTPGIGLAWFVGAGRWREALLPVGIASVVAGASFVIAPGLWSEWYAFVRSGAGLGAVPTPLWVRLPLGAVIAFVAGRAGSRWPVPIAVTMALPLEDAMHWTLALAAIPLAVEEARAAVSTVGGVRSPAPPPVT